MSECSLSGRRQGHVSNFYIVDLENFVTASRRYTGNIVGSRDVHFLLSPKFAYKGSVPVPLRIRMSVCH